MPSKNTKLNRAQSVAFGFSKTRYSLPPVSFLSQNAIIIAALAMMMALCLLVYNLGQRQVRQALAETAQTIPNQLGKPTEAPTLRWVFQCFLAVHLVVTSGVKQIANLTPERWHILKFFSDHCRRYYLLHGPDP